MFYTKYRPQKFSEISKPNEAADALVSQLLKSKTAHAYLFVGSRGTGKTTTARILAKALNCHKLDKNGDPCDKCESCEAIRKGTFLDLIEIDAASNRGIDDIRELKNKIRLAPSVGDNKIYIIDEVHMLTNEAFNALLKTLEEPPAKTTFILCTTEFNKVPETIRSRCQVYKFKRATLDQIITKLKSISQSEKIKISEEELRKLAKASQGGFRDAETLLEQVSEGDMGVDTVLNISSKDKYLDMVDFLLAGDTSSALSMVDSVFSEGVDIYYWMGELIRYVRDILFIKSGAQAPNLDFSPDLEKDLNRQVAESDLQWLAQVLEILAKQHSRVKGSYIAQLPLELAVVEICSLVNTNEEAKKPTPLKTNPSNPKVKVFEKTSLDELDTKLSENIELKEILEEQIHNEDVVILENIQPDAVLIGIDFVKDKWSEVVSSMSKLNGSLMALLKSGNPLDVEGNILVIEVFYPFHKERLESPKNRTLIEDLLKKVLDVDMRIKCKLNDSKEEKLKKFETGVLTDFNVVPVDKKVSFDKSAVIEMLDGGLPMI